MKQAGQLMIAVALALSSLFAATWPGSLVDGECWAAEERNVNPRDTTLYVDRDRYRQILYCRPTAKTKSYTIVDFDGLSIKLDPASNAKAAEAVRQAGKLMRIQVTVTGERQDNTITADSIVIAR
jgi:hypothetical protein